MLRKRSKYTIFALLLAAFIALFFYLRMNKPKQLQRNAYQEWSANFVGTLDEKTYIKHKGMAC